MTSTSRPATGTTGSHAPSSPSRVRGRRSRGTARPQKTDREIAAELVRSSCAAQGIEPIVTDRVALAKVATLMTQPDLTAAEAGTDRATPRGKAS